MKFDIPKYRIVRQQLTGSKFKTATELVRYFGAIQGQEYAQTKWGIGLRLNHLNDDDIEADLSNGRLLRTHLLRPTWHIVSGSDIRWLIRLTAPRVKQANAFMYKKLELDKNIFNRSKEIIEKKLEGNAYLTRSELNSAFKQERIIAEGHRLSYIMMDAELEGLICSGPRIKNQFTYGLLEERAPHSKALDKDEALAELTIRYFTSRGPATVRDYATWSGLTLSDCKKGIAIIRTRLSSRNANEDEYYFTETPVPKSLPPTTFLLPPYDEFIIGYKDRSMYMNLRNSLQESHATLFNNMIMRNGQIIGSWRRTLHEKSVDLECSLFRGPAKGEKSEMQQMISRFEEFINLPVKVTLKVA